MTSFETCQLEAFVSEATPQSGNLEDAASTQEILIQQIEGYLNRMQTAICTDIESLADADCCTFLELTDTPAAYTGEALNLVRVNAAEDALEFFTLPDTTLQEAYDAAPAEPQITVAAGDPLTIDLASGSGDIFVVRDASDEVLFEVGGLSVTVDGESGTGAFSRVTFDSNRSTLALLPDGNSGSPITSAPATGSLMTWESRIETDYLNETLGNILNASGTWAYGGTPQAAQAITFFRHATTFENLSGSASDLTSVQAFVDIPLLRSTGGARTMTSYESYRSRFHIGSHTGGGSYTLTDGAGFVAAARVDASSVLTNYSAFQALGSEVTIAGTLTNWTGLEIEAPTGPANIVGISCDIGAGAGDFFINHTGTAESFFGGEVDFDADTHRPDNIQTFYGDADDASIEYNGTNLIIDSAHVGSGRTVFRQRVLMQDNNVLEFGNSGDWQIDYDSATGNLVINQAIGAGFLSISEDVRCLQMRANSEFNHAGSDGLTFTTTELVAVDGDEVTLEFSGGILIGETKAPP